MSTKIVSPRSRVRFALDATVRAPLVATLALLLVACVHHTSSRLTDLCEGGNVAVPVVLVIDSVATVAGHELARLRGERFDIVVNLFNRLEPARCPDRSGEASVSIDDLPDELAGAASKSGTARWRIDGLTVVVELNPGVYDNNLSFSLPLDGSDGHWTLSRFPGVIASGRLIRQQGDHSASSSTRSAPLSTASPAFACTAFTFPAPAARSSFSIFMASITTSPCPALTLSPGSTFTRTMSPGIGATSGAGPTGPLWAAVRSRMVRVRSSSASIS